MRDVLILFVHLIVTAVRVMRPGGIRSAIAESVLLRHQLLVLNRPRKRAPDLRPIDRVVAGLCARLVRPARLLRSAIVLKPATILNFHRLLVKRKYRDLLSPKKKRAKPGPKGPSPKLVAAIVAIKRRNLRFGYQRLAEQMTVAFDIHLDKDVSHIGSVERKAVFCAALLAADHFGRKPVAARSFTYRALMSIRSSIPILRRAL